MRLRELSCPSYKTYPPQDRTHMLAIPYLKSGGLSLPLITITFLHRQINI